MAPPRSALLLLKVELVTFSVPFELFIAPPALLPNGKAAPAVLLLLNVEFVTFKVPPPSLITPPKTKPPKLKLKPNSSPFEIVRPERLTTPPDVTSKTGTVLLPEIVNRLALGP